MSRLPALVLLLAACSDYNLNEKEDNPIIPGGDTGVECPPQIPDCHDSDEPVDTQDTQPVEPGDCDVIVAEAGTVAIVEDCEGIDGGGSVTDPWNLVVEYQHNAGGANVVMPAIGNLTDDNGDGRVDELDIPDIAYVGWNSGVLTVVSGDGSGEHFSLPGYRGDGGVSIADVDADGSPELIAADNQGRIHCIDGAGTVEWTSAGFNMLYPVSTVADLDGDGMPEVIFDVGVVRGDNGATVATLTPGNFWRSPVAADLDQDGTMEIILGEKVFDHNGNVEWSSSLTGTSAFAAVADIDGDPEAEVFMTIGNNMGIYEADGTLIRTVPVPGANNHPGPPCMADFDGDGDVEIAVPEGSRISMFNPDGTKLWDVQINDSSGAAGCSGYDVDGDYVYELIFADQDALRIYDGATGAVVYENFTHGSVTYFEYPTVGDVDGDGSAEIVVASSSGVNGITVFGHGGDGWNSSGPTWPVHDFGVTNVEPDGTVPANPVPSWQAYNVFRARPVVDEPAASDLDIAVIDLCVVDCDEGPVKVSVRVRNQGAAEVPAGTPWAFYRNDNSVLTLVTTGTLPVVPAGAALEGFVIEVMPTDIGAQGFVLRVDDDGTGNDQVNECDEDNNELRWTDRICW